MFTRRYLDEGPYAKKSGVFAFAHFMLDLYLYSMPAVYQDLPIDIKMDKLMPSSVFSSANIQNVSGASDHQF